MIGSDSNVMMSKVMMWEWGGVGLKMSISKVKYVEPVKSVYIYIKI